MAKYEFFLSYAYKDLELAKGVQELLQNYGHSVFKDDGVQAGAEWVEFIAEGIANSAYFIPLITDRFLESRNTRNELSFAIEMSRSRGQIVLPLIFTTQPLSPGMRLQLSTLQQIRISAPEELTPALEKIHRMASTNDRIALLYEKLVEYRNLGHGVKEAETVCQLIALLCQQWGDRPADQRKLCMELCRLLEKLARHSMGYTPESKAFGYQILGALSPLHALLSQNAERFMGDIFFSAFAVQMQYWDWEASVEAVDLRTSGDVFTGCIDPFPVAKAAAHQKPYVDAFEALYSREKDRLERFTQEEQAFIHQTTKFVLQPGVHASSPYRSTTAQTQPKTQEDEILLSIAKFMQEGNQLFDLLQKRGAAGDFLKCLLTSYERLKAYCQIVGATDVAAQCVDRIVEIRGQLDKPGSDETGGEKAEKGIKSLLGLTLRESGNYDVFISFKSEDSDLAEKVYQLCQRHMKVPFWSKRTLPELSKSEYEDAIYDALRKSKHFVVVLSKLEYLQANWIMREMKAFDRAITEGRKPGGNFVFVATDEVYSQIIRSNKMCLDERYCGYQILKMSEYEKTLMQYIT